MLKLPVPPALLVGLAIGIVSDLVRLVTGLAGADTPTRWNTFSIGMLVAEYLLVGVGLLELARRVTGPAHRALQVAGWLTLVLLTWYVANPLLDVIWGNSERLFTIFRWSHVATGAVSLVIALCVVVAAQGFQRVPAAAVLVLIANLARGWIPYLTDDWHRYLWEHRVLGHVYWVVIGGMWSVGIGWLGLAITRAAIAPVADPFTTAAGFRQAAWALNVRIFSSILIAVLSLGLLRSMAAAKILMIGGPLVMVATMVVCALGCLRAAQGRVDGLPRLRLVVGAALTLWWGGVQLNQLIWLYRGLDGEMSGWRDSQAWISAWSILGPLLATAGLALVGSAISRFAAARANDELREAASVRTLLLVVLFASSIVIQSQLYKATTRVGLLMLGFVAAVAAIGALISFVGLLKRAADAMHDQPGIPAARVVG